LLSGLPTDRFCFEGFPPRTKGARSKWFKDLSEEERTIIFFEAPHRIVESLTDAAEAFGKDRTGAVCREMSKQYEEVIRGSISQLISWASSKEILGEITVVVEGFDLGSREFSAEQLINLVLDQEKSGEGVDGSVGRSGLDDRFGETFDCCRRVGFEEGRSGGQRTCWT
jgi:16S rRNA (cytidine1402-2'-O)-methyltransferase